MTKVKCNLCASDRYEERRIEYLYSHQGQYLLVPNTPVVVCLGCGMVYDDAAVLKEIEQRFFAIQNKTERPDRYIEMPEKAFASPTATRPGAQARGHLPYCTRQCKQ